MGSRGVRMSFGLVSGFFGCDLLLLYCSYRTCDYQVRKCEADFAEDWLASTSKGSLRLVASAMVSCAGAELHLGWSHLQVFCRGCRGHICEGVVVPAIASTRLFSHLQHLRAGKAKWLRVLSYFLSFLRSRLWVEPTFKEFLLLRLVILTWFWFISIIFPYIFTLNLGFLIWRTWVFGLNLSELILIIWTSIWGRIY